LWYIYHGSKTKIHILQILLQRYGFMRGREKTGLTNSNVSCSHLPLFRHRMPVVQQAKRRCSRRHIQAQKKRRGTMNVNRLLRYN
jgi:hypothetical protein